MHALQRRQEPLYHPRHSRIVWSASWLFLLTALYAATKGHYDLAIGPAGIFATSLNYWRHPVRGCRRNFDIAVVWMATGYQLTRALFAQHTFFFYAGYALAFSCYPLSNRLLHSNRHLESALLHSCLHLFSNISSIVLFSGTIENTYEVAKLWLIGPDVAGEN
jgi:hypothetical protein